MKTGIALIGTLVVIVSFFGTTTATIWHVHPDSIISSIQTAIDSATAGDTVLVHPETYYENINFNGKNIVLGSLFLTTTDTSYISSTIIDGDSSGVVVSFRNFEDSTALLTGFTIQNGRADLGGGIACSQSSPTVTYCTIVHNEAEGGGGIACYQSSPTITNCTVEGNWARWIFLSGSDSTLTHNAANRQPGGAGCGGGILCLYSSDPIITNCTIANNEAFYSFLGGSGGGISCLSSSPRITNCTIEWNWAILGLNLGGGISCWDSSSPTITDCTIRNNFAGYGGGIACFHSFPNISYCLIRHNTAEGGGGISCWDYSLLTILNCTITCNTATHGGGICYHDCGFSSSNITNTILWADNADEEFDEFYIYSGAPPVHGITYSDIEGGWPGEGIINCDPWFCYGNYYLAENSCCVGSGQGGADIGAFGIGCDPVVVLIRADANADMNVQMADAIFTLKYLYVPGSDSLSCMDAGDSDDNGEIAMSDAIYTLKHLYVPGSPQPPAPFPDCGADPTADGLSCEDHPCMGGRQAVRKKMGVDK